MPEEEIKKEEIEQKETGHLAHSYQSDLSKAMNVTEASVVVKLLDEARSREANELFEKKRIKQKGWYTLGSLILIILTLGALAYGVYYYKNLTVKVVENVSVGIFPLTDSIVVSTTDIRQTIKALTEDSSFSENKPFLVNLVSDKDTLASIGNERFFEFIESRATEPFQNVIALPRLGIMNTGNENIPFIIMYVKDPEIAAKEFLIAETSMLNIFYRSLNIDISNYDEEIGKGFVSGYMYNLPVRILSIPKIDGEKEMVMFYGSITNNIVVVTTDPSVLKAIYDSVIRQ